MTELCPRCGTPKVLVGSLYREEVQNPQALPERLGKIAPPTARAALHLFLFGLLLWLTIIYPAFASERPRQEYWRDFGLMGLVTVLWFYIWRNAKYNDHRKLDRYEETLTCPLHLEESFVPSMASHKDQNSGKDF